MSLLSIQYNNFRNLVAGTALFDTEGAVFFGKNGSGKTAFLEAIHLLSTGKSQRGGKKKEMISFSKNETFLEGIYKSEQKQKKASIGFNRENLTVMEIDSQIIRTASQYFSNHSVLTFGPQDNQIVSGDPIQRRNFMDFFLCQQDTGYVHSLVEYKKNLDNRNSLLRLNCKEEIFDVYETNMDKFARYITNKRAAFIKELSINADICYSYICSGSDTFSILFASSCGPDESLKENLKKNRFRDIELGYTSIGPHREDIKLQLHGKSIKQYGSQGQQRSAAIVLKLALLEMNSVTNTDDIIILVDDAFSDLDPGRTEKIFSKINGRGQLFVSSLLKQHPFLKTLQKFSVNEGKVSVD